MKIRNHKNSDFINRMMEQDTIIPDRFIWHVADQPNSDLKRFSIATEGLKCEFSQYNAIFANNGVTSLTELYPVNVEIEIWRNYMDPWNKLFIKPIDESVLQFDFWRIDTHVFFAQWRIDPNMKAESYVKNERNFICTAVDIPPSALKLYKVVPGVYLSRLSENVKYGNTVFPVSLLTLDERINYWIKRKMRAA